MAVAFSTHASASPVTTTNIKVSLTVGGTNPVLIPILGIANDTATVTSVTWSPGSGTTLQVCEATGSTDAVGSPFARTVAWAVPAPNSGSGTLTAGFSASVPIQCDVLLFIGAHQTTPCVSSDAVSTGTGGFNMASTTFSALNVTANDAMAGGAVNTVASDPTSVAPNQTFRDNTTAVNLMVGYSIGNNAMTYTWADSNGNKSDVIIRIAAAAAGGATYIPDTIIPLYNQTILTQ